MTAREIADAVRTGARSARAVVEGECLDVGRMTEDRAEVGGQGLDLVVGEREPGELRDVLDVGTGYGIGHDGRV